MAGEDRSLGGRLFRWVTRAIEPFYAAAASRRNRAFDTGKRPIARAHCPVVSIGNITAGGTGKTPMVGHIVEQLKSLGRTSAVLIRGYKATADGSDEAELLSSQLGDVPVIVHPDRVAGAARVMSELPGVNVLVLDDGFQHRRLARDLDIVLIDATNPWGFGHVLPRGLLREPVAGLARADAVIVTRCDQVTAGDLEQIDRQIESHHGRPPIAHAAHRWSSILDRTGRPVEPTDSQRVIALCGIGNPVAFFRQVDQRFDMVEAWALPDHHDYAAADVATLERMFAEHDAAAVVTTEKDWVKLQRVVESAEVDRPIWRPQLTLELTDGADALRQRLTETLATWTPSSD